MPGGVALESIGPRTLYCLLGIGIGVAANILLSPDPVEVVRTEVIVKTRVELKTEWKDREVIKWKTRTVTKPDGTTIVEHSGSESSTSSGSSSQISDTTETSTTTIQTISQTSYRLGVSYHPSLEWQNPRNYLLTAGVRLGSMPLWLEGQVGLEWIGIGVSYEWH
jgi:hypothetical protein